MSDFLDPFFNSISHGNCLADASTNLPTYDPFFNSVSTAASANRPIRTRVNTRRILANDTFANRRLAFASTNPPTYDPFFNSLSTAASANRPIRTRARTRRTIANDTFANRSIHPRAKKRRITDDMRASEAVRFALGLLEDEFNQRDAASKEFPPEISFSHLRSSENAKHLTFEGLEAKIVPVFPIERSIKIKEYSVRRRQVPMCPAFSLTDYKVQGSILTTAVLDLKNDPTAKGQDGHKKFCSLYV